MKNEKYRRWSPGETWFFALHVAVKVLPDKLDTSLYRYLLAMLKTNFMLTFTLSSCTKLNYSESNNFFDND